MFAFVPKNWQNLPFAQTPLSAEALIDMESRLSNYTDASTSVIAAILELVPIAVKSANFAASVGMLVPVDASAGTVTITLPGAPADQSRVGVKIVAQATPPHDVTILHGGSDVFEKVGGTTSLVIDALFQTIVMQYDAAIDTWYVVSAETPLDTPLGASKLGNDGKIGGPGGSPLATKIPFESRNLAAPPMQYSAQTGGPNLAIGSTFPNISEPTAYSNTAYGGGWRGSLPHTGNLGQVTTGNDNTAIGAGVLISETTGQRNTAVGADALSAQVGANNNTAVGAQAAESLTTGHDNCVLGTGAMQNATTANFNVAVGTLTLGALVSGQYNVAVGYEALLSTTGSQNVAVGLQALQVYTGSNATAVGAGALAGATGTQNSAVGWESFGQLVAGASNTGSGYLSGFNIISGSSNTCIGNQAGYTNTTDHSFMTLVGMAAGGGADCATSFGYAAAASGTYSMALGPAASASAAGAVAIGTDSGGAGASSTTANKFVFGTGNHTYSFPGSGGVTVANSITGLTVAASGLTGATAAGRFVGATSAGAPTTGTFVIGDFVVDRTGKFQVCTTAGSPGTWTPVSTSPPSSSLLASVQYAPATATIYNAPTTLGAMDATNLTISFTAPASGSVIVKLQAYVLGGGSFNTFFGLLNHVGGALVGVIGKVASAATANVVAYKLKVTGLTPGNVYQYDFAYGASGAQPAVIAQGTTNTAVSTSSPTGAPASMEVWSA